MTVTVIGDNTGDDYSGTGGLYLSESNNSSNRIAHELEAYNWAAGDFKMVLLEFTGLSNISATDTVSAVTVGLYQTVGNAAYTLEFRKLLRNWVIDQATWDDYATASAWTTGGAQSDGNDRHASTGTTASVPNTSSVYHSVSAAQITSDTQDWVDGTSTNYGFHIAGTGGDSQYKIFSSERDTDGQRPYMSVTHAAPAGNRPQGPLTRPFLAPFAGPIG